MGDRSVDAHLAAAEATVELQRRHEAALRRVLDVDGDLRRTTGLGVAGDHSR